MRRMTAAALLATVLLSSLPWEVAGQNPPSDGAAQVEVVTDFPAAPDSQGSAPPPDECPCLCIVGPGAAVEGVAASPGVSTLLRSVRTNPFQRDQTHTSDVLSRLFRPPRLA